MSQRVLDEGTPLPQRAGPVGDPELAGYLYRPLKRDIPEIRLIRVRPTIRESEDQPPRSCLRAGIYNSRYWCMSDIPGSIMDLGRSIKDDGDHAQWDPMARSEEFKFSPCKLNRPDIVG